MINQAWRTEVVEWILHEADGSNVQDVARFWGYDENDIEFMEPGEFVSSEEFDGFDDGVMKHACWPGMIGVRHPDGSFTAHTPEEFGKMYSRDWEWLGVGGRVRGGSDAEEILRAQWEKDGRTIYRRVPEHRWEAVE